MLQKSSVIGLLFLAAASVAPASACEFHGMGFGPMGSKWSAYYPDDHNASMFEDQEMYHSPSDKSEEARSLQSPPPPEPTRARPTFSSASTRAARSAKAKIAEKKSLENNRPDPQLKSDG